MWNKVFYELELRTKDRIEKIPLMDQSQRVFVGVCLSLSLCVCVWCMCFMNSERSAVLLNRALRQASVSSVGPGLVATPLCRSRRFLNKPDVKTLFIMPWSVVDYLKINSLVAISFITLLFICYIIQKQIHWSLNPMRSFKCIAP